MLCYVVLVLGIPRYSFDGFSPPFRSDEEKPRAVQVEGTDRSGAGLSAEIRPRVAILGSENPETLRFLVVSNMIPNDEHTFQGAETTNP